MTGSPPRSWLRPALAAALLVLVLIQPDRASAINMGLLLQFPLELPVILFAMMVFGDRRSGRMVRAGVVVALTAIFVLRSADIAMTLALGRGFDPVSDLPLIDAAFRFIDGSFGRLAAVAVAICATLLIAAVAAAIWWATGVWARIDLPFPGRRIAAAGLALAMIATVAGAGLMPGGWKTPEFLGTAGTTRFAAKTIVQARDTMAGLREFATAAAQDRFAGAEGLLDAIDRDVLIVFIESYGRTSIDTPYYAELHRATLDAAAARLSGLGLAMRSAYLASPTSGGQSWLAHASLANGLWVDDQSRYRAVLASGRQSLFHIASRSGFRTAAVEPAITMPWPESQSMGFDTVLAAKDLGYRGKPFNWVTMPDQFTLAALDRNLRSGQDPRPLFAEVVLVSSHAPWVPVPVLLDWDRLGDGHVFDEMATSGDPPKVVWSDPERVRAQYRMAIDYALTTVFDYAARHAKDPPLMIILGDHQTAGSIAMDERAQVPVHLIGPPSLIDRTAAWGWSEGLIPAPEPVIPMSRMRDMILRAFTTDTGTGGAG
ncbi:sulfatase-like hydrolase/transferase [Tropicimonas sp. IMCC34043]|uniref:sulfatase-like hydrolase/transferase n=1 Tax=Tropicimonas sp. IMCC34043 TaxID=2248760 RepID=UPI001E58044A|nr:sulfatase-like hydrolase/transferase [Tropicimonas sp. IMCC34043]